MSLADTRTETIAGYYPATRKALYILGLDSFRFIRDIEKCQGLCWDGTLVMFGWWMET